MIHKINEPKFEPEMHDSRSQTGKRPPPITLSEQQSKSPTNITESRKTFQSKKRPLPSFVQPYGQQLAGQPINPFSNNSLAGHSKTAIAPDNYSTPARGMLKEEETSSYMNSSNPARSTAESVPSRWVTSVGCPVVLSARLIAYSPKLEQL